jgi:hypothetical protein
VTSFEKFRVVGAVLIGTSLMTLMVTELMVLTRKPADRAPPQGTKALSQSTMERHRVPQSGRNGKATGVAPCEPR